MQLQGRLGVDGAAHGAAARGSEGEALEGGEAALVVDVRAGEEREGLARTERAQADGALGDAARPGRRLDVRPLHAASAARPIRLQREDGARRGDAAVDLREEVVEGVVLGVELTHQLVRERAQPLLAPRAPRRRVGATQRGAPRTARRLPAPRGLQTRGARVPVEVLAIMARALLVV